MKIAPATQSSVGVLILDDQRLVVQALCELVQAMAVPCSLWPARRGEEAIEIASHHPLRLSFLDQRLPDCHGGDVAQSIRQRQPESYIVLMGIESPSFAGTAPPWDNFMAKPPGEEKIAFILARVGLLQETHLLTSAAPVEEIHLALQGHWQKLMTRPLANHWKLYQKESHCLANLALLLGHHPIAKLAQTVSIAAQYQRSEAYVSARHVLALALQDAGLLTEKR